MAQDAQRETRYRWIGIGVATVALLGWVLALYFWSASARSENALAQQRSMVGSVAEIETRMVTLRSEAAQAEIARDQGTSELVALGQQLDETRADVAALTNQVQALRDERQKLETELSAGRDELGVLDDSIAQARQAVADTSQELSDVGARLEEARVQEAEYQARVADLSAQVAQMTADASDAQQRVQAAREAEASLEQVVVAARQELDEIESTRIAVDQSVATLVQRRDLLAADIAAAEEQMRVRQAMVVDLSQSLVERGEHLADLEARIAQLQDLVGQPARAAAAGLAIEAPYVHGAVAATFAADGTFRMRNSRTGEAVAGAYSLSEGVLILSEAEGNLGDAAFPMRCRISAEAAGFTLADEDGTCFFLAGFLFSRGDP
jgi:DNA repair exonuclease SbcCD ATPase subunit